MSSLGMGIDISDRQNVYTEWKCAEKENVKPFEKAFSQHVNEMSEKKAKLKETLETVNDCSRKLAAAKETLQRKRSEKKQDETQSLEQEQELIDEEEYALLKEVKDMKLKYRSAFIEQKELRTQILAVEQNIRVNKQQLVRAFEEWYGKKYAGGMVDDDDAKDAEELYDELETKRLEQQHPDALPYFKAKKLARRSHRDRSKPRR